MSIPTLLYTVYGGSGNGEFGELWGNLGNGLADSARGLGNGEFGELWGNRGNGLADSTQWLGNGEIGELWGNWGNGQSPTQHERSGKWGNRRNIKYQ